MHLTQVRPESTRELQAIADAILRSSNIVVITGAGISTNAGIPDYCSIDRSYHIDDNGTLKEAKAQKIKIKDLFHTTALSDETTRPHFLSYHTRLRQFAKESKPTLTHHFIRELCVQGRLIRNYTQNIDDREREAGLCTDLQRGYVGYDFTVGVLCLVRKLIRQHPPGLGRKICKGYYSKTLRERLPWHGRRDVPGDEVIRVAAIASHFLENPLKVTRLVIVRLLARNEEELI
ncbi:DHS-like NAD/FAD-binding domain-containing protein [Xylariomycetidae sp. FL2044]|nr:DHS-like NAD/FAD-binding domain-containing protein [Xylariomycetidae sp. FL2044]